jgi:hypothetical protein
LSSSIFYWAGIGEKAENSYGYLGEEIGLIDFYVSLGS